jgi:hypothetical protein
MNTRSLARATAILVAALVAALGGCNSGTGDCPPKASIQPGGSCSDDDLQCPYDLSTPSPACDGTTTTIPSSCTCTDGTWACPSPVVCGGGDAAATGDGGEGDAPASG